MTNKRMSTQVIAEILTEEIETLKQTVDEVKQLHKDGIKIDQEPLNEFMNEFRRTSKRKLQLPKWLMVFVIVLSFFAVTGTGAAVYLFKEKQRWEDLAHQWREAAVELGYEKTNDNQNK